MPYSVTLQPDGNLVANVREEIVVLQPVAADYPTGGYLVAGSAQAAVSTFNIGFWKVLYVVPIGGEAGYKLVWNPATFKVQVYAVNAPASTQTPLVEVAAGTDLSALAFRLLVGGIG